MTQRVGHRIIERLLEVVQIVLLQAQAGRHRMAAKLRQQSGMSGRHLIEHVAEMKTRSRST